MIYFNIISRFRGGVSSLGMLDMPDPHGIGFKRENSLFRFCDVSMDRSVEFTVPSTEHNRQILSLGEDPAMDGQRLRRSYECQMVHDGGVVDGLINITGWTPDGFTCVFYPGSSHDIEALIGKKLEECEVDIPTVMWSSSTTPTDADQAGQLRSGIIKYDNGLSHMPAHWQLAPSVNLAVFVYSLLSGLDINNVQSNIPNDIWMIAGKLKGEETGTATFTQTDVRDVTFSAGALSRPPVTVVESVLNYKEMYLGFWHPVEAMLYRAERKIKLTFGTVSDGIYLVKRVASKQYQTLAGLNDLGYGDPHGPAGRSGPLSGATIELEAGTVFFFADKMWDEGEIGYYQNAHPLTLTATVAIEGTIEDGDFWDMNVNMPDITVFEFLKSAARAAGMDLIVRSTPGIQILIDNFNITAGDAFRNVIGYESVTRRVDCWGEDTKEARVAYKSEDYVENTVAASYTLDTEQVDGVEDYDIEFNDGSESSNGVLVKNLEVDGDDVTFHDGAYTLAQAVTGKAYLQRMTPPSFDACDDIADNATCVRLKVLMDVGEFLSMPMSQTRSFRGVRYVWTDGEWSEGIATLTLQKF